jgi:hypothetical protein
MFVINDALADAIVRSTLDPAAIIRLLPVPAPAQPACCAVA